VLTTPGMMRMFRLPNRPKPLAEVADRFHLTPLIRAMTSPHDVFVLALAEESVRLIHAFADFPPERMQVPNLPRNAEEATRRPSIHVRAPRRRLQNLEGEKVLLHQYVRKVEQAIHSVLAGRNAPLVLAAEEPLVDVPFAQYVSKAGR
jgi:Bacterial archaeo-eukaryotic release factor family 11